MKNKVRRQKFMALILSAALMAAALPAAVFAEPQSVSIGGFLVTGGVQGSDYRLEGGLLKVMTDTPLTIKNQDPTSPNGTGIQVLAGVHADVTLSGVNIAAKQPFDIVTNSMDTAGGAFATSGDQVQNKTSCHITLADGTDNILDASKSAGKSAMYPGLRCGEGSILTIDDGVRNMDVNGVPVVPEQGKIGADVTLVGGRQLHAGDPIASLDSNDPGTLTVKGGYRSAAIGSGPRESSGRMTFNGGDITAVAYGPGDNAAGAGCGIGGGIGGSGTDTNFNAGKIDAYGSYHGAGIGGGCTIYGGMNGLATDIKIPDAIYNGGVNGASVQSSTLAGDMTINGGLIKAKGYTHGNAIGKGCGGTNTGKTIKITGGTVLPDSTLGDPSYHALDIGGTNGYVVVTGGSVRLSGPGKFDSIPGNGGAYGDDDHSQQVFMTTIDLSGDEMKNYDIAGFDVKIAGAPNDYGSPYVLDENSKLYLWLPKDTAGKEVAVELSVRKDSVSEPQKLDTFFITNVADNGTSFLKRYVEFDLPGDGYQGQKDYDGVATTPFDFADHPITTEESIPKVLDQPSYVLYKYQPYGEDGQLAGEESAESATSLPVDSGTYRLTMTSTQYSMVAPFSNSYWGHRGYGTVTINPVASHTSVSVSRDASVTDASDQTLHITADFVSGEDTAKTCAAPTGAAQLYIDGEPVGDPIPLVDSSEPDGNATFGTATGAGGRYHTVFSYDFVPSEHDDWVPKATADGKHQVSVKYLPDKNYLESIGTPAVETVITPIEPSLDVYDDTDSAAPVLVPDGGTLQKDYADFAGDDDWFPLKVDSSNTSATQYASSNPNVAVVDEQGKVHIKGSGTTTITVKKPANGAFTEREETFTLVVAPDGTLKPDAELSKGAVNSDHPDGPTRPDDLLEYTITAKNKLPGSLWKEVVIRDQLPAGVELLTDTLRLQGPRDDQPHQLTEAEYTLQNGLLSVPVGDVHGSEQYILTFKVRVKSETGEPGADEQFKDITNIATGSGSYGPDGSGSADSELTVSSDPATPAGGGQVLPHDPQPEIHKTGQNLDRNEGQTHVDDRIRYEIEVENRRPGSLWKEVAVWDKLPAGLILVPGSMVLQKPDGTRILVSDSAYDPATRIISVYVGEVYGGQKYIFSFEVTVAPEAVGKDIGNTAEAIGYKPGGGGSGGSGGSGSGGSGGGSGGGTDSISYKPGDPYFPAGGSSWPNGGSGGSDGSGGGGSAAAVAAAVLAAAMVPAPTAA